jgi:flagellar motor switch protein FliN/FliY
MTKNQKTERIDESFVRAFSNALVEALSGNSGSAWLIAADPDAALAPDGSEPVRFMLTLNGGLRGEVLLEINLDSAAILASKLLQQPTGEFGAEESKALLKLIETSAIAFRTEVEQEYGAFTITASSGSEPSSDGVKPERITVADGDSNRASILIYLNPSLIEALFSRSEALGKTAAAENLMKAKTGKTISEQANLNLVMDVELNVTLRFGQRQLTLREVLELTSGSVVELDRQVEEPVELLLDSRVIARGEAVVIDGNYGLRVTEVCQSIFSPARL